MSQRDHRFATAFLVGFLLPGAVVAQGGWLSGKPSPKVQSAGAPEWLIGAEGGARPRGLPGYPTRVVRITAVDRTLEDVVGDLLKAFYPDQAVRPRSEVPDTEAKRRISLRLEGTLEQALEVTMVQARCSLWVDGQRLRWAPDYRQPPLRPPTAEELQVLERSVQIRTREQEFGKIMDTLGTFLGKIPLLPATESKRKLSVSARGPVAQVLEALGTAGNMELWVDGPYLRATHGYLHREARVGVTDQKPMNLNATDQSLDRLASVMATFTGKIVCMPATLAGMRVDVEASNETAEALLKKISEGRPFRAFEDGPFLRFVEDRQATRPARRFGPEWEPYLKVLYGSPPEPRDVPQRDLGPDPDDDFGDF